MTVDRRPGETSLLQQWADTPDLVAGTAVPEGADVGLALASVQHLLAGHLAAEEHDEQRRAKMLRVVERQQTDLARLDVTDPRGVVASVFGRLAPEERVGFLVESFFLDPFSPYSLKTSPRSRRRALTLLVAALGQDPDLVSRMARTATSARRAYRNVSWAKVGLIGVGGAALLGIGGFFAAPMIGTAIGGAAGLAGAAATNFGLALLGGGSLAAGGAGMAGGLWLVTGTGAALGAVAGAGAGMLFELGAARARQELLKLQVTFKLTVVDGQVGQLKAQEVLQRLGGDLDQMRQMLEQERALNDENARRVKELEATVNALEAAIGWMTEQQAAG